MQSAIYPLFLLSFILFVGCTGEEPATASELPQDWPAIEQEARGSTVDMMMWSGDPLINAYMQQYVVPGVRERYGITLNIAAGQGNQIVQTLMKEMEAGRTTSDLDLLWINGETFYQLRQIDGLYGPWVERLPNAQYIDLANPFIGTDFQQPIAGYEAPWGNVQMAIIYDTTKVASPPRTREELATFVKANPGRFTFDTQFTGMTFLKGLLIDIAGGPAALNGPFDEEKYRRYSAELWDYIREIRPYLWKQGQTFPEGVAPMHQMFANGELWFTMSNNDSEVDNKILQGVFPPTAKAYVWESGTIQNTHYLGIPRLSASRAAAMVVVNFLISPEAQLRKQDPTVWGDGTVLALDRLTEEWRTKFEQLPARKAAPPRAEMQRYALQEPAPEYMIRLAGDFRREIIEE